MYVNPFWMGVLTTIGVELLAIVVAALASGWRNNEKQSIESDRMPCGYVSVCNILLCCVNGNVLTGTPILLRIERSKDMLFAKTHAERIMSLAMDISAVSNCEKGFPYVCFSIEGDGNYLLVYVKEHGQDYSARADNSYYFSLNKECSAIVYESCIDYLKMILDVAKRRRERKSDDSNGQSAQGLRQI